MLHSTPCLDPMGLSSHSNISNNGEIENNSNESPISPSLNEPIQQTLSFQPRSSQNIDLNSNEHSNNNNNNHSLPKKYRILHTNPNVNINIDTLDLSQSHHTIDDDEIQNNSTINTPNSNGFLPMQAKDSVTLDNSRLITTEVLTASDVHDEDQKYIEKLSPSNSHHNEPPLSPTKDNDTSIPSKTNQHRSNKSNQSNNNNNPNLPSQTQFYQHSFHRNQADTVQAASSRHHTKPIGGIPTTPSYATPLSGPVLNEWSNRNQYLSLRQQPPSQLPQTQILSRAQPPPNLIPPTQGTPLLTGQSASGSGSSGHTGQIPSAPPSVVGSIASNSYRRGSSQFMDTQQHRKRTNKLKFTRSKWSDHAKRVLLNTTYVVLSFYYHP